MRTTIGVDGIDALIEGGVPRGAAVLVSGEAGTAKSVLCLQFILAGIREGEPGVYATADNPGRIFETAASLGWDFRGAVDDGYAQVIRISRDAPPPAPPAGEAEAPADAPGAPGMGGGPGGPPAAGGPGGGMPFAGDGPPGDDPPGGGPPVAGPPGGGPPASGEPGATPAPQAGGAEGVVAAIAQAVLEVRAERVVIDPALPAGESNARDAGFIADVVRGALERTHCTTMITGQRVHGAPGYTRLGVEEGVVDGIIDMVVVSHDGRRSRVLSVRAMHGTKIDMDDHPFSVVAGRGIVIGEG